MAGVAVATNAAAATLNDRQQLFITRGSDALHWPRRSQEPYPPRFYGDVNRGIKAVAGGWRAPIETNNRNWLQRYSACAQ